MKKKYCKKNNKSRVAASILKKSTDQNQKTLFFWANICLHLFFEKNVWCRINWNTPSWLDLIKPLTSSISNQQCVFFSLFFLYFFSFFVVLILYFVAGILFMKYKKEASGKDLIPNREFWTSLPGLVKVLWCNFFPKQASS